MAWAFVTRGEAREHQARGSDRRRFPPRRWFRLLVAACTVVMALPAAVKAQGTEEADVRAAIADLIAADNAGALDAVVARYTEDAILLGPLSPPVSGRSAIREHYARLFATYRFDVGFESYETRVAGDWAFDRGLTTGALVPVDGSAPIAVRDRYLMILRKDGGAWLIARLMWNADDGSGGGEAPGVEVPLP